MASQEHSNRSYPPELTSAESAHLLSSIKDWSIAHGLAVRPPPSLVSMEADPHGVLATTAPVTLFPSPFPRVCFEQAKQVQKVYNHLYASISQDEEFLKGVVEKIMEVDDFTAEQWKVHLKVKEEGYTQKLSLGLFRSDYMAHQTSPDATPAVKQVEFNTIASSFGPLSCQTSKLHKYLSTTDYPLLNAKPPIDPTNLPENPSTQALATGLRQAFSAYTSSGPSCILFLVQSPERNILDQRHLEYHLQSSSSPTIPIFRLTVPDILTCTTLAPTRQRQLIYHPPSFPHKSYEVAVIYLRAGYTPTDYEFPDAWKARLQIERSYAIKCPSILLQLSGTKKVQQILATPSTSSSSSPAILTHFLPSSSPSQLSLLQETFTNIYPFDSSPAGIQAQNLALDPIKCKNYVLKPQREGGGNNIYRSSIPSFLRSIPESRWKSYVLMEIIVPPPVRNVILRNGVVEEGGVICELGVYGVCLWDAGDVERGDGKEGKKGGGKVLYNEEAGYLLRTKGDSSEEGGVAAGFGAMDSCLLV